MGVATTTYYMEHRVLLDKLTVTHLVNKFPVFYSTRSSSIVLTRDQHWALSLTR